MSNKETIINEIIELFRAPDAFFYHENVYKVCSWGACKSYLTWPDGAPEGWDDLDEETEFFVGRSGEQFVAVRAEDDSITRLYTRNENNIEDTAEHICWALDLPEHEDNECEELS
jgi:hypothetical protein